MHYIDKKLVADSFAAGGSSYEENAIAQRKISYQLARLMRECRSIDYSRSLEIGCCTGVLADIISGENQIDVLIVNDIVAGFCNITSKRIKEKVGHVEKLYGDIECTVLPRNLDLVMSSSTLQWMVDLQGLLQKIKISLKKNGHLAFSIFSLGTMEEIAMLTGRGLRYFSLEELKKMLQDDFRIVVSHIQKERLFFPTLKDILCHIRQTGVGGVERGRWTCGTIRGLDKQYHRHFLSDKGLPVTYVSTFIIAESK